MDPEDRKAIIEIWKTVVEVQQHFNDIEMRIRSIFITIVLAISAAIGYLLDKRLELDFGNVKILYAALLPLLGIVATFLFYFMDRHWYHRLLVGAVEHGLIIEKKYADSIPELGLSGTIGKRSPVDVKGWWTSLIARIVVSDERYKKTKIMHSDAKVEFFYKSIVLMFSIMLLVWGLFGGISIGGKTIFHIIELRIEQIQQSNKRISSIPGRDLRRSQIIAETT